MVKKAYQGSLKASFHHPCLAQWATILSSLMMISEKDGLAVASGCQHSSIKLYVDQGLHPKPTGSNSGKMVDMKVTLCNRKKLHELRNLKDQPHQIYSRGKPGQKMPT